VDPLGEEGSCQSAQKKRTDFEVGGGELADRSFIVSFVVLCCLLLVVFCLLGLLCVVCVCCR